MAYPKGFSERGATGSRSRTDEDRRTRKQASRKARRAIARSIARASR